MQYSQEGIYRSSENLSAFEAFQPLNDFASSAIDYAASNPAAPFNEQQPSLSYSSHFTEQPGQCYFLDPSTISPTNDDPYLLAGGHEGSISSPSYTSQSYYTGSWGPDEFGLENSHQESNSGESHHPYSDLEMSPHPLLSSDQPQPPPKATSKPAGYSPSRSPLIQRSSGKNKVANNKQELISPRPPPPSNDEDEIDEHDFDFTFTKFRRGERALMKHSTLSKYRCYAVTERDLNVLGGVTKLRPGPSRLRYSTTIISNAEAMWRAVLERELRNELEADAGEVQKSDFQTNKKRRAEDDDEEKPAKKNRQE